jgi:hypothetical protein
MDLTAVAAWARALAADVEEAQEPLDPRAHAPRLRGD